MIPRKLKDDAIIEAMVQVVFASPEIPEVIVGRLTDSSMSAGTNVSQLPQMNIPAQMRRDDENLRHLPLYQISRDEGRSVVRVGERVISAHVIGQGSYPGWDVFKEHVATVIRDLFQKVKGTEVHGVTLRYINALNPARHHVDGPAGLNLNVHIDGSPVQGKINLNVVNEPVAGHFVTTRIADISFVQGSIPDGTKLIVDVEVSTGSKFRSREVSSVLEWIDTAHRLEKEAFFCLIPKNVIDRLKEE